MNKEKIMKKVLDDLYSRLYKYMDDEPYKSAKKYFIDASISLELICTQYLDKIELKDRLAIEQAYIDVCDVFSRWDYGSFFYRLEYILSDQEKIEFKLREGQFDCLSMASSLRCFKNKYSFVNRSLLDSFLSRSPKYANSCLKIINSPDFDNKSKELAIYGLLAVISAHTSYLESGYNFYIDPKEKDYNPQLKENSKKYIMSWCNELRKITEKANESESYINYSKVILNKGIKFGLDIREQKLSIIIKKDLNVDLWTAINLLRNSDKVPKELIQNIKYNIGDNISWIIKPRIPLALFLTSELDNDFNFNLTPNIGSINIDSVIDYLFPSFRNIPDYGNLEQETAVVDNWKDDELQRAICDIIKASSKLTEEEKMQMDYESEKKDSGYEIADIVIPININNNNIAVCIPLKTGREVGKSTPNLPSKMVIHQILKPFQHYKKKACVILISVRRSSQDLANMIQKAKVEWNWPIIRLEGRHLIALLKYHSKIELPS